MKSRCLKTSAIIRITISVSSMCSTQQIQRSSHDRHSGFAYCGDANPTVHEHVLALPHFHYLRGTTYAECGVRREGAATGRVELLHWCRALSERPSSIFREIPHMLHPGFPSIRVRGWFTNVKAIPKTPDFRFHSICNPK